MLTLPKLAFLGIAVALLAAATATAAQPPVERASALEPSGASPLEGTRWRLRHYRYRDIERTAGPQVAGWLQLSAGRLVGSGGCTKLRGSYSQMGAALSIDLARPRKPSCGEQTTLVQLGMVEGLKDAASYRISGGETSADTELSILDMAGVERLRFGVDDPGVLFPDRWQLTAFSVSGQRIEADGSQPAVLSLQPKDVTVSRRRSSGDVVSSSGCNGIIGRFFRHADVLSFGELERTDAPCEGPAAAQEAAVLAVLEATSITLRLPPDRLVLTAIESGDQLEFVTSHPLEESTWLLRNVGSGRASGETVSLRLRSGTVSGEGPCGSYSGRYATDGTFISFSDLQGAGSAACSERRAERDFLKALRDTVLLERGGSRLRMRDTAGAVTARFGRPEAP